LYCFAGVVLVRGSHNTPRLTITVHQINARINCLPFAIDFQIDRRITSVVFNTDVAGGKASEVRYLTDVLLQLLVIAQESFGRFGRLAVADGVKRDAYDSSGNDRYDQSDSEHN
jgi:hypothetical protein